jgi:predicted  nucleic acid-binding Zn-ribbon protein
MSAAFNLFRLQQADSGLLHARGRREAIEAALEDDAETREARQQAQSARDARLRAENSLREAEYETLAARVKIQQVEASLYAGRVSNPKELQDLQKDLESLRRHLVTLEDRQLEAMLALEESESADARTQSMLELALASAAEQTRALEAERASLQGEIERLETERQAIAHGLDAPSLAHYDALKAQKRGVAVAALSDGACGAREPLPPSQQQAAHISEQMVRALPAGGCCMPVESSLVAE